MLNCFLSIEKKNLPKFVEKKGKHFFVYMHQRNMYYLLKLQLFVLFDIRNLNRRPLLDEKILTDQKLFVWYVYLRVISDLCKNLQNQLIN